MVSSHLDKFLRIPAAGCQGISYLYPELILQNYSSKNKTNSLNRYGNHQQGNAKVAKQPEPYSAFQYICRIEPTLEDVYEVQTKIKKQQIKTAEATYDLDILTGSHQTRCGFLYKTNTTKTYMS